MTAGGRGGKVIAVTNLNDSGPGSLRAAVGASGPRTVIFKVSGTIALDSRIDVTEPRLTIAGQTAPGGGVTLRMNPDADECVDRGTMQISTSDVIIRYLRFRPGPTPCADDSHDAVTIYKGGAENVAIDHSSFSWAVDENVNTYDASRNITVSNSIISEALANSTHPEGEHSKGMLAGGVGAHNISIHNNLFVSNIDRNPQISGVSVADIRNNVIYNYGDGSGDGATLISSSKGEPEINWVNNYYKPGPDSPKDRAEFDIYDGSTGASHQWFGEGNVRWTPNGVQPARVTSKAEGARVTAAFDAPAVNTLSAGDAYTEVLANAGASYPHRDAVDARLVKDVRNGTGGVIDDPSDVGGYPALPTDAPAPADADGDGMPNAFETQHGTNPDQADANGDSNGNGYTNIEDWFNGMVGTVQTQTGDTTQTGGTGGGDTTQAADTSETGDGAQTGDTSTETDESDSSSETAASDAASFELVCPYVADPRAGQEVRCRYQLVS